MTRILLVEDDNSLGATLHERLQKEPYEVHWETSLAGASQARAKNDFDLYILDVGLPDGSGFDFAKSISGKPIVFLTAQSDAESRLRGYDLGADEFIPKPFHLRELLLRIHHVIENHVSPQRIELGALTIDFDRFTINEQSVQLKDMQLLKLLMERSPKAVSRDESLNRFWGEDHFPSNRTVDNAILRLRAALGPAANGIESVRGVGYRWNQQNLEKLL